MRGEPPAFDLTACSPAAVARAAEVWQSLRFQEERSRLGAERVACALARLGAPREVVAAADVVVSDEARHVGICERVLVALGREPEPLDVDLPALPSTREDLERALTTLAVAGFAVAETMSVGGFAAARKAAREPIARWALGHLVRDEVGHGAFGELAGAWLMRAWTLDQRLALWPKCVAVMEEMERKAGGPLPSSDVPDAAGDEGARLGAPRVAVVGTGMLRSIPRWVLPRLTRLGVLPA